MKKIVAVSILIIILFVSANIYAEGLEYSAISFTNQYGVELTSYPSMGEQLYARATVDNTSNLNKQASLVVGCYKDGMMKNVFSDSKSISAGGSGELSVNFTLTENNVEVLGYALSTLIGYSPIKSAATMLSDNTMLKSITIDGKQLEGYSDDIDEYVLSSSKKIISIKVEAVDGATKIEIPPYILPGVITIKVIPPCGGERIIKISVFNDYKDLYTLSGLKYKIGDTVYDVGGFSPNRTSYNISLPDNTYLVKFEPEYFGGSMLSYSVSNSYSSSTVFDGGITYGSLNSVNSQPAFATARQSVDGNVPIRWGNGKVIITVNSGSETTSYTINLTSNQPYLTEFNYIGAASDASKPMFVAGGGLVNDNGSIGFSDRRWALSNVSKNLIGASYFAFPVDNKSAGTWWASNTTGEYFNFTAGTSGVAYIIASGQIANNEYVNDGWEMVTNPLPAKPSGESDWRYADKTYNGYGENVFFMAAQQWQDDSRRTALSSLSATTDSSLTGGTGYEMFNVVQKHFTAGENVKVYHTGKQGTTGAITTLAIRWDKGEYPYMFPKPEPEPEIFDESLRLWVKHDNNTFKGNIDKESLVWKDLSGHGNNISIVLNSNIKWTDNGLSLNVGSDGAQNSVALSAENVQTLNSDKYSLVFRLNGVTSQDGKDCPIFSTSTINREFSLMKSRDDEFVYFKIPGATIKTKQVRANISQVSNGVNVITVEKKDDGKTYVIWYIDGIDVSDRNFTTGSKVFSDMFLGGSDYMEAGTVLYKEIALYNKVLSVEDVAKQGDIGGNAK